MMPETNLGQSTFQDTFFVACAQETPYRRLRQLDLEIRELESSLFSQHCGDRRNAIRKVRIEKEMAETTDELRKEELQIDLDELAWEINRSNNLIQDAIRRLENFKNMRSELIANAPLS